MKRGLFVLVDATGMSLTEVGPAPFDGASIEAAEREALLMFVDEPIDDPKAALASLGLRLVPISPQLERALRVRAAELGLTAHPTRRLP